jgi:23S rRNA pseudouridine1911/1915/1917 synthase
MEEDSGTITGHIGRHSRDRMQFEVYPEGDMGKHAVTHYKVLKRYNYVTLVSCKLETGRTHQIRVHMKHIGHTLFNDHRYGGDKILKGTVYAKYKQFIQNCFELMPRQALHAATLGLEHPTTGKRMFFEQPLPADFTAVLDKWERYWATIEQQMQIED